MASLAEGATTQRASIRHPIRNTLAGQRCAHSGRSKSSTSPAVSVRTVISFSPRMATPSPAESDVPCSSAPPRATCSQPIRPSPNTWETPVPGSRRAAYIFASCWMRTDPSRPSGVGRSRSDLAVRVVDVTNLLPAMARFSAKSTAFPPTSAETMYMLRGAKGCRSLTREPVREGSTTPPSLSRDVQAVRCPRMSQNVPS